MTRIPAPLLRGLTVVGIGATLVVGHITFAAAQNATATTGRATETATAHGENCYLDTRIETTSTGKRVVRRSVECD